MCKIEKNIFFSLQNGQKLGINWCGCSKMLEFDVTYQIRMKERERYDVNMSQRYGANLWLISLSLNGVLFFQ